MVSFNSRQFSLLHPQQKPEESTQTASSEKQNPPPKQENKITKYVLHSFPNEKDN